MNTTTKRRRLDSPTRLKRGSLVVECSSLCFFKRIRIEERFLGFLETDSMISDVQFVFVRVPIESHEYIPEYISGESRSVLLYEGRSWPPASVLALRFCVEMHHDRGGCSWGEPAGRFIYRLKASPGQAIIRGASLEFQRRQITATVGFEHRVLYGKG